jgi:hypothetical protein
MTHLTHAAKEKNRMGRIGKDERRKNYLFSHPAGEADPAYPVLFSIDA